MRLSESRQAIWMFYEDWGTVYCPSPVASPLILYRNKKKKRDTRVGAFFARNGRYYAELGLGIHPVLW